MNVALIVLLVGLVLALALLVLVLRSARARARRDPDVAKQGADQAGRDGMAARLRVAVLTLFAGLVTRLPRLNERYGVPLLMLTGDSGSGKSAVLAHCGLAEEDAAPDVAVRGQLQAWHFNQAVVLEVGGGYLGDDGGAGAGADDAAPAWNVLGARLQRYRPRRPLDGIVLCLPAELLCGPRALGIGQLEQHAGRMQRRLGEMQDLLGLRLPVYLLITKSDHLEGYASFAATLPPALRTAMLGWSNPNPTDAAFAPEWGEQAFDAIVASVALLQAELVAGGAPLADADAFFMLSSAIGGLRDGVGAYLTRLLCQNAQREPVFFRGLYLCGAAVTGDAAAAAATVTDAAPLFLADLMKQKVLPEATLARPLRGQVFSRNGSVRRWRTATVLMLLVWAPWMFFADRQLEQRSDGLLDVVKAIDVLSVPVTSHDRSQNQLYNDKVQRLMNAMVAGQTSKWWMVLPWSWPWFDGTGARIDSRFHTGLKNVVFPAIARGLNEKAADMAGLTAIPTSATEQPGGNCSAVPSSAGPSYSPQTPPTSLGEFQSMVGYVYEAARLDKEVTVFTVLQTSDEGSLDSFRELGAYSGAFALPPAATLKKNSYLARAVRDYTTTDERPLAARADLTPGIRCGFERHADAFYARLLVGNPVLKLAGDIDDNMHASEEAKLVHPGPLAQKNFADLRRELGEIKVWLTAPAAAWLHTRQPDFGPGYSTLKTRVAGMPMLGSGSAHYLDAQASKGQEELEMQLLETSSQRSAPPVLQRSVDGSRLELTPELAHLDGLLSELAAQPFMGTPALGSIASEQPGQPVLWSLDGLNQALLLRDQQRDYLAKALGGFPAHFRPEVQTYADGGLADMVVGKIVTAQSAAANAQEAAVRLGQSQKLLSELLVVLAELKRTEQRAQLAAKLSRQAELGLAAVEAHFAAAAVYQPRDRNFAWWDGSRDPAAQGFAGGDPQALNDYLDQQHSAVADSVKLARPLLRLLADTGDSGSAPARRWTSLAAEYDRYDTKQPGNRIAALDAYVRGELSEADQHSCYDKPSAVANLRGADFFTARERELAGQLNARCGELGRSGGTSAYGALAALFSRTLAHKFPFAQASGGGRGDADPADVASFLQAYDQQGAAALRMLPRAPAAAGSASGSNPGAATGSAIGSASASASGSSVGSSMGSTAGSGATASGVPASGAPASAASYDTAPAARVRRFLEGAAGARKFLAPVLAGADGAAPAGYDVSVRFRVDSHGNADNFNQLAGEVDGNKIVAWTLQIGDRVLAWQNGSKNETQTLPWQVGMPVLLTLRWSDNVATVPVDDGADPYRSVRGREVRYSYSEPWSLLRLLASRRRPDVATARYDTLQFDFPTAIPALPGAGPGPANTRAHVYMRLGLTAANQKEALNYPGFPVDAPGLDNPTLIARP